MEIKIYECMSSRYIFLILIVNVKTEYLIFLNYYYKLIILKRQRIKEYDILIYKEKNFFYKN